MIVITAGPFNYGLTLTSWLCTYNACKIKIYSNYLYAFSNISTYLPFKLNEVTLPPIFWLKFFLQGKNRFSFKLAKCSRPHHLIFINLIFTGRIASYQILCRHSHSYWCPSPIYDMMLLRIAGLNSLNYTRYLYVYFYKLGHTVYFHKEVHSTFVNTFIICFIFLILEIWEKNHFNVYLSTQPSIKQHKIEVLFRFHPHLVKIPK